MNEVKLVLEKTDDLIDTVKESFIYKEYQQALTELNGFPELKVMTDAYRKARFELYHVEAPFCMEKIRAVEAKREELAQYEQIDRFLKAELHLGRILQEVQSQITQAMELG